MNLRAPKFLPAILVFAGCGDLAAPDQAGSEGTGIELPGVEIGGTQGSTGASGGGEGQGVGGSEEDSGAGTGGGDGAVDESGSGDGKGDETGNETGAGGDEGSACGDAPTGSDYDFSIIWISNTGEGTVSKIDTVTGTELARYRTGEGNESPSRTSVNLSGDVAVGNRNGSVAKFATREEDCVDRNGNGVIDTSTGAGDVLAYGDDECWLWTHDVGFAGGNGGPRAIAWDGGDAFSDDPCDPGEARVWVGWRNQPSNDVLVRRLDGQTGEIDNEVLVEGWNGNWGHGTYGGATDREGNFWGLGTRGTLIRVDAETFEYERWDNPDNNVVYGIALDANGNPWVAGWDGLLWRFDVANEEFQNMGESGGSRLRGLAIAGDGMAWAAANNPCGVVQFDIMTQQPVNFLGLDGCSNPVGVSIDADGFVWVVDRDSDRAYKVNPEDYAYEQVLGLVSPYTYSDMTGSGLSLVVVPQ